MNFKRFALAALSVLLVATGCYRDDFARMQSQFEDFSGAVVNTLSAQKDSVSNTIEELQKVDTELKAEIQGLISMRDIFNNEIAGINTRLQALIDQVDKDNKAAIESLTAIMEEISNKVALLDSSIEDLLGRVGSLEAQIAELQQLEGRLTEAIEAGDNETKEWVENNFASLDAYRRTAEEVGAIQTDLGNIWDALSNLSDVSGAGLESLGSSLREEIRKVEEAYKAAVEKARQEVLAVIERKVIDLKNWVVATVDDSLDFYYDMAQTDRLLENLRSAIEAGSSEADQVLLAKIDSLSRALTASKEEITAAYQQAIRDVAAGIEAKIADLDSVRNALHNVDSVANATVENLTQLTGRVKALEDQAAVILADITRLQNLDSQILATIDSLGRAHKDSLDVVKDELERLRQADITIQNTISELEAYVRDTLSVLSTDIREWVSGSYATIARQNALADSLAVIYSVLGITPDGSIGGWVSTKFDDYYTIAQTNFKLDSLGHRADTMGQNIRDEIAALKTIVTADYQSYIAAAIANGGLIGNAIADSVGKLRTYVDGQLQTINGEITDLKSRLTALENVVQSVVFIPEYDDGKIFVSSEYNEATGKYSNPKVDIKLRYKINTKIATFDPKNYSITGDIVEAMAATKAAYAGKKVTFKTITFDSSKSILECTFNSEVIPDSFYDESKSAALSLMISDANTDISSAYVGLRLQKVSGSGGGGTGGGDDPVGKFRVDPAVIPVGNQGGVTTAMVLASSDFRWKIKSKPDWVDIQVVGSSVLSSYEGTQFIAVSIAKNTDSQAREGVVTFVETDFLAVSSGDETATLTIHQEKREIQSIEIFPSTADVTFNWEGFTPAGESSYVYTVEPSDQIGDWTVSSPASATWLHVSESKSLGAGKRDVTITVDRRQKSKAGYYTTAHEADITFTSVSGLTKTIHVTQDLRPYGELVFTPAAMSAEFDWDEYGSEYVYNFKIQPTDSLKDWTYQALDHFDDYFDGRGYGQSYHDNTTGESKLTLYPKKQNNTFEDRTGKIRFTTPDGQTDYEFTAIQKARPSQVLEFSKEDVELDFTWDQKLAGTDNKIYEVKVTPEDGIGDWPKPEASADWITVGWDNRYGNDGSKNVTIKVSETTAERSGSVVFKGADNVVQRTIAVNQTARPEQILTEIITSPDQELTIPWRGDKSYTLTVRTNDGLTDWTFAGDNDFQAHFKAERQKDSTVVVTAKEPNSSLTDSYVGQLTFTPATAGGTAKTLTFTLAPRTEHQILDVTVSPDNNCTFSWKKADNSSYTISVNPSDDAGDWELEKGEKFDDYFTIPQDITTRDSDGNGTFTVNVKGNNRSITKTLEAKLIFKSATGDAPVELTFRQTPCDAAQTFTDATTPANGSTFIFKKNRKIKGSTSAASYEISVATNDGFDDWTFDPDQEWVSLRKTSGKLTVSVNEENNTGANRSRTVTISSANGDATLTYTVTQAKDNLFYSSLTNSTGEQSSNSTEFILYSNKEINGDSKVKWEHESGQRMVSVRINGADKSSGAETDISESLTVGLSVVNWNRNKNETLKFTLTSGNVTETWKVKVTTNNSFTPFGRGYTFEPVE